VAPLPLVLLGLIAWHAGPRFGICRAWRRFSRPPLPWRPWTSGPSGSLLEVVRSAGFVERLLGAGAVVVFYLYKALWPAKLIFVYPQWRIRCVEFHLVAALGCGRRPHNACFGARVGPGAGPHCTHGDILRDADARSRFHDVYFMKYSSSPITMPTCP